MAAEPTPITVRRDGKFWYIDIPSLGGGTQAHRLTEVDAMARDYISLITGEPANQIELDVHFELPQKVDREIAEVQRLREQVARMQQEAAERQVSVARALQADGLTVREIGRLLNVSFQRAQQLVSAEPRAAAIHG